MMKTSGSSFREAGHRTIRNRASRIGAKNPEGARRFESSNGRPREDWNCVLTSGCHRIEWCESWRAFVPPVVIVTRRCARVTAPSCLRELRRPLAR